MRQTLLNVGSGYLVLKDFDNLDNSLFFKLSKFPYNILIKPFLSKERKEWVNRFIEAGKEAKLIRQDCRKKLKYENDSVDHILCSHFLEHLFHHECIALIKEFHRVLTPGGTVHIILPDLKLFVAEYLNNDAPNSADKLMEKILAYNVNGLSFNNRLLDITGNFGLHHLWMYDRKSMNSKLEDNGFVIYEYLETPSSDFRKGDSSLHIFAKKI